MGEVPDREWAPARREQLIGEVRGIAKFKDVLDEIRKQLEEEIKDEESEKENNKPNKEDNEID